MRVIFMGTPDFSVPVLQALAAVHQVAVVYCQPPRPAGRGKQDRPSPVQVAAQALGLPVRHPGSLKNPDVQAEFAALNADAAVVVAYGLILPPAVLAAPRRGCLNIHASLLPRWRGAAPVQRAIMAGDVETGICIMQMDAGLDTGAVLLRQMLVIGAEETAADLLARLSALGAAMVVQALADPALVAVPQPATGVTYAAKIDKAEARVDWTRPAVEVDRLVRALSPHPGAWCLVGDERLKLVRSRVVAGQGAPGQVLGGQVLGGLVVACGVGALEIMLAQREGKRALAIAELLRGWDVPEHFG